MNESVAEQVADMKTLANILVVLSFLVSSSSALASPVYGAIGDKWKQLGAQSGPLGGPTTDELNAASGGRFREFQYGFIYWHPDIGAYAVYGRIGEKWNQLGRDSGPCGYPTSDEYAEGRFRRSNFQYGSILWSQQTGAQADCNPRRSNEGACEYCNDNTCQCRDGCGNHGGVRTDIGCSEQQ